MDTKVILEEYSPGFPEMPWIFLPSRVVKWYVPSSFTRFWVDGIRDAVQRYPMKIFEEYDTLGDIEMAHLYQMFFSCFIPVEDNLLMFRHMLRHIIVWDGVGKDVDKCAISRLKITRTLENMDLVLDDVIRCIECCLYLKTKTGGSESECRVMSLLLCNLSLMDPQLFNDRGRMVSIIKLRSGLSLGNFFNFLRIFIALDVLNRESLGRIIPTTVRLIDSAEIEYFLMLYFSFDPEVNISKGS